MNNTTPQTTHYIFLKKDIGTLWYAIFVLSLLSTSEHPFFMKIMIGTFAIAMLFMSVIIYNFLSINKLIPQLEEDTKQKEYFVQLHHQLFVQMVWMGISFVSMTFWFGVILLFV